MADRTFSSAINIGKSQPHFQYIFDPTAVGSGTPQTGTWRPFTVNDIQNNTLTFTGSGIINVTNVAVTGGFIAISNVPTVTLSIPPSFPVTGAGGFIGITGSPTVSVVTSGNPLAISGNVTINSGSFGLTITGLTGSQSQIPIGAKSYQISIISGNAFINGVGPITNPYTLNGGKFDGHWTLNTAINFGCTGVATAACLTIATWES